MYIKIYLTSIRCNIPHERPVSQKLEGKLERLNESFGNTLSKGKLLKTGGYDQHSKHQNKDRKRLADINETTRETLNYATQEGAMR